MADENNYWDILSQLGEKIDQSHEYARTHGDSEIEYLKSIDTSVKNILKNNGSQSAAKDNIPNASDVRKQQQYRREQAKQRSSSFNSSNRHNTDDSFSGRFWKSDSFIDQFEKSILDSFVGDEFKRKIHGALNDFTDLIGVDLKKAPGMLGQELGKFAVNAFKGTKFGQEVYSKVGDLTNKGINHLRNKFNSGAQSYATRHNIDLEGIRQHNQTAREFNQINEDFNNSNIGKEDVENIISSSQGLSQDQLLQAAVEHLAYIDANLMLICEELGVKSAQTISKDAKGKVDASGLVGDAANQLFVDLLKSNGLDIGSILSKGFGGDFTSLLGGTTEATAAATGTQAAATGMSQAGTMMAATEGVSSAMAGLAGMIPEVALALLALYVAAELLDGLFEDIGAVIESISKLFSAFGRSANRDKESRKKAQKAADIRRKAELDLLIIEPFRILEEAANKVYAAWDNNLQKINGTQGYTKSDLQNLMGSYAERLRDEGLSRVVAGTDIVDALSKVLDSGLAGPIAEEFAYQATKLNAAVPTQDFFNYSQTYATIAANQIKLGKSQAEAIQYANQQLESFASSTLYASRQLAGGFSTGLQNANQLFEQSVKIAQTARIGDASQIAGVLTSVSSIVGAVAPDLASSVIDAIMTATTGGNSSEAVALRSLAGVNASNTEFLKIFAQDPKKVFTTIFKNLASMQNMADGAYMEVAEGLSGVFGLSTDALARIDFNYLADNISKMNVDNSSLDENLKLLISGETVRSSEQLKIAEANQYMIEHGLALVLENDTLREVQRYMWEEQKAREMQEATYGVEIEGAALELIRRIVDLVDNVLNLLNPFSWFKKAANMIQSAQEAAAQEADLRQLIELTKVGNGNLKSLYQLTTRNVDHHLVDEGLIGMYGGVSAYKTINNAGKVRNVMFDIFTGTSLGGQLDVLKQVGGLSTSYLQQTVSNAVRNTVGSFGGNTQYNWGTLSKSSAQVIAQNKFSNSVDSFNKSVTTLSTSAQAQAKSNAQLEKFISEDYMKSFIDDGKSYDDYIKSAKNLRINDLDQALEDAGYTEQQLQQMYTQLETQKGVDSKHEREEYEREFFWNGSIARFDTMISNQEMIISYQLTMIELTKFGNDKLCSIFNTERDFYNQWVDYYVNHTAYNKAFTSADVFRIKGLEAMEQGDAANKLADILTSKAKDLTDPAVQTNVLLAQILNTVLAIMQQNNSNSGSLVLPDAYAALASGMISTTNL